ncbi:MAG: PCC domain-containing protein [Gemmatimonadaceae bacterium]
MQLRQFEASSRGRQFVLVLETNEDPLGRLIAIAEESHIAGAHVTGIGAFSRAKVAFWNPERSPGSRPEAPRTPCGRAPRRARRAM